MHRVSMKSSTVLSPDLGIYVEVKSSLGTLYYFNAVGLLFEHSHSKQFKRTGCFGLIAFIN